MALDAQWAEFFARNQVLVGISMDGTAQVHDTLRPAADGSGTHSTVMENLQMLRRAGVECNVLAVVTRQLARSINQTYDFFSEQGVLYQQYIPCMDRWRRPGADGIFPFPEGVRQVSSPAVLPLEGGSGRRKLCVGSPFR